MIINSSVLFSTQHVRAAHHSAAYHLALLLISLSFRDAIRTIQLWGNSAKQSAVHLTLTVTKLLKRACQSHFRIYLPVYYNVSLHLFSSVRYI